MFFLSICPGEAKEAATVLAISQAFRNARKYYRLTNIMALPASFEDSQIKEAVERLWRDKVHQTYKRRFSQDRRPVKIVQEHPRLIMNCTFTGDNLVENLRRAQIPVEAFSIQKQQNWSVKASGKALGDDYRVGAVDILHALRAVYVQKRLEINCASPEPGLLACRLERINAFLEADNLGHEDIDNIKLTDPVFALAIPVWFRENIRYHRSYRA